MCDSIEGLRTSGLAPNQSEKLKNGLKIMHSTLTTKWGGGGNGGLTLHLRANLGHSGSEPFNYMICAWVELKLLYNHNTKYNARSCDLILSSQCSDNENKQI